MKNLIKFEFRKLTHQKYFYVCTFIMAAMLFLSIFTSNMLIKSNLEVVDTLNDLGLNCILNAVTDSSFVLIIAIFTVLFVCDDYEQQIIKNIYARGYSRKMVYISKMIFLCIAATIMFVIIEMAAVLFANIYFDIHILNGFELLRIIGVQYVVTMANIVMFYAISSILRKNGVSIAACFVVPVIINMLLGLLDSFFKIKNFSISSIWISSFLSDMTNVNVDIKRIIFCLVASVIYILIFTFTGLYFNKNTEL